MAPQKRTRIDPTAMVPIGEDKQSPLAIAFCFINAHVTSLLPGLAAIFAKLGHQHLLLLTQRIQRQEMIDKLSNDDTFLPHSARIEFDLSMPKAVKEDPEHLTLKRSKRFDSVRRMGLPRTALSQGPGRPTGRKSWWPFSLVAN